MASPFMKFYIRDWQSDYNLRQCSIAARGLWLELLCMMHQSNERGCLCDPNGNPLDEKTAASICAVDADQYTALIDELQSKRVFSRDEKGRIYSRRMVGDDRQREVYRQAGLKGGGNPALRRKEEQDELISINESEKCEDRQEQVDEDNNEEVERNIKPLYSDDFIAFWKAYPRKIGKGAAWKAWKTIKHRPETSVIICEVERQSKTDDWQKDYGKFIPHPATWLNQRRWEDEGLSVELEDKQKTRYRSALK